MIYLVVQGIKQIKKYLQGNTNTLQQMQVRTTKATQDIEYTSRLYDEQEI